MSERFPQGLRKGADNSAEGGLSSRFIRFGNIAKRGVLRLVYKTFHKAVEQGAPRVLIEVDSRGKITRIKLDGALSYE